jgi:hypothetical protein
VNNQTPKTMRCHLAGIALLALLATATHAATINWDGGGDGVSWSDRLNWRDDIPPSTNDDVVIASPATTVLLSGTNSQVTVRSVQCDAGFTLKDARLTFSASASYFHGPVELSGSTLVVNGTGASLVTAGAVVATNASFYATGGAVVTLPDLAEFHGNSLWHVSGAGSVLRLPGLTNLAPGFAFNAIVSDGGQLLANNLVRIGAEGYPRVRADGTNSMVDFGSLREATVLALEAWHGATIWAPQLTGGPEVGVELRAGGLIPTAQFRRLLAITVSSATADFAGLTNFDDGQLEVTEGGMVSMPALEQIHLGTWRPVHPSWTANGTGSLLSMPGLVSLISTDTEAEFSMTANGGGQILATNLVTIAAGYCDLEAGGAGSALDLRNLSGIFTQNTNSQPSQVAAFDGGTILLNTQAMLLCNVTATLPPGHTILPATTPGSPALNLYGQPGHAYTLEWRDTQPGASWQFLARVPMTTNMQTLSPFLSAHRVYRVTEFLPGQPVLDCARMGTNGTQITVYGTPGKTLTMESCTDLNDPLGWEIGPSVTLTNAFHTFPPEPTTGTMKVFRAREE